MVASAEPPTIITSGRSQLVVAASLGGLPALSVVLAGLPATLAAAVVVVQHIAGGVASRMDEVLGVHSALPVQMVKGDEATLPGCVFLAPAGRHVLIAASGALALSDAAPVGFVRPSANLLFESAAAHVGAGTTAVVLTGRGDDGAIGVLAMKRAGGTVIAQNRASSRAFGMLGATIANGCADFILPLELIAPKIRSLVGELATPPGAIGA